MSNIHKEGLDESKEVDISDEISLRNFIFRIKEYYREVKQNWLLLLLLSIPFIALLSYNALTTPDTYPARMTFMVNEESKGGGVGGLLSQIGFGGGASGSYNLPKVIELSRSREIIKQALFTRDTTQANPDFLINDLITVYNLREIWAEKEPDWIDFSFKHNDFDRFTREENSILKKVHVLLIGKESGDGGLVKLEVSSETSIFKMEVIAEEERLSLNLLNGIYHALSTFYISETIKKPENTFTNLKARTDSVREAMMSLEYRLAKDYDTNLGLITRQAQLKRNRLERELRATGAEYTKLVENLGVAEFTLDNATPVFQVVDSAIEPIDPIKKSLVEAIIFGAAIGIILGIIFLLLRKIYRDAMRGKGI